MEIGGNVVMTDKELDKMFEKMSRECANKMKGTHPPKPKKTAPKKTVKKVK